jgi:hypothetical protein
MINSPSPPQTASLEALFSNSDSHTVVKLPDFFPAPPPETAFFALSKSLPNCAEVGIVAIKKMVNVSVTTFFIVLRF